MSSNPKKIIAQQFGESLDRDDFGSFKVVLDAACIYKIGDQTLKGPSEISGLYEKNMQEGKLKFDELIWGASKVKEIDESTFEVYFSDILKHKGIVHNYRCKQIIKVNDRFLVAHIQHQELANEQEKLNKFYQKVGLK